MLKRNQPMLLERMGKMQSATDVAEDCKYDGFDGLKRAISLSDEEILNELDVCLLYTSPSPRDISGSRMPSSA